MFLIGAITFHKRVRQRNKECWGTTKVNADHSFHIRIAKDAVKDQVLFAEVLLHELFHLWITLTSDVARRTLSERQHHRIIDRSVPTAVRDLKQHFTRRK